MRLPPVLYACCRTSLSVETGRRDTASLTLVESGHVQELEWIEFGFDSIGMQRCCFLGSLGNHSQSLAFWRTAYKSVREGGSPVYSKEPTVTGFFQKAR